MSLTNDDLLAISDMMDKKLQPINNRLDKIDDRLDSLDDRLDSLDDRLDSLDDRLDSLKFSQEHITEKLKGIEVTMNYNDYHLSHDIRKLQEDVDTISEILKINKMIPIAK